jgi:hypothetical protein
VNEEVALREAIGIVRVRDVPGIEAEVARVVDVIERRADGSVGPAIGHSDVQ